MKLKTIDLKEYPAELESFFNDNYGYREEIVNLTNRFKYYSFRNSHTKKVIIGKNDYLYYTNPEIRIDFRGGYTINKNYLDSLKIHLEEIHKTFAINNISFSFTVVPNKQSIYPEHLPDRISATNSPTRLHQVESYFEAEQVTFFIPLFKALNAQKGNNIYRKRDTHWSHKGANIASNIIIDHLRLKPRTDLLIEQKETSGDLARMLTMEDELLETIDFVNVNRSLYTIDTVDERYHNENAPIKKMIALYGDSFGMHLRDLFVENFETVVFIKNTKFNIQQIIKLQPDFVIYEVVERDIKNLYYDLYLAK